MDQVRWLQLHLNDLNVTATAGLLLLAGWYLEGGVVGEQWVVFCQLLCNSSCYVIQGFKVFDLYFWFLC